MMKHFRTLMLCALLALGGKALADDYQYLSVTQTDGETSYTVSSIQKITFTQTTMVLHLTNGSTEELPLGQLQKMFFSGDPAGIGTMSRAQSKVQFSGGVLRADLAGGEHVALYNMKGEKVFSTNESGTFSLQGLTNGVYIVKVGAETKKVVNK